MKFEDCINSIVCEEIKFKQDTAERKNWFTGMSFSHPAKMILGLQIYLIERYSKVGETILDPMAGSGTALFGATIGRNVICVELEKKFCDMMEKNWQKIKSKGAMLGYTMGEAAIIQGDARQLPKVLADTCIFSPPYAESNQETSQKKRQWEIGNSFGKQIFTKLNNPSNIGNLKYGSIDKIISSPPYEGSISGQELPESEKLVERKSGKEKWGKHLRLGQSQLTKYADAVITSPPYEEAHNKKIGGVTNKDRPDLIPYSWTKSDTQDNIGNLKSDNYLAAMLEVYRGCFSVLKDNGLMVLVVKNFIRDKKIIRLDTDTTKLCEAAGFTLKERLKRKLTQQSFWRTIYYQKYPSVPKIEYEDVLVFKRADALVWNGVVKNEQKE